MWRPLAAQPAVDLVEAPSKSKANENPALERTVWIRAHPAVHDQIFDALHDSASSVLDSFKKGSASDIPVEVEIVDMRGKINIFEIMGPKTSQVLKGALQPVEDSREEFKKVRNLLLLHKSLLMLIVSFGNIFEIYQAQGAFPEAW